MIAFVFIFWHVFHMHGWFHADWWQRAVAHYPYGGIFRPYNAASTAGEVKSAQVAGLDCRILSIPSRNEFL